MEVYACAFSPSSTDITSACTPLFPSHVTPIPLSSHAPVSPILPAPVEDGTMGFLSVDVAQLEGMDAIAVVVKPGGGSNWVLAEFGDKEKRVQVVEKSTLRALGHLSSIVNSCSKLTFFSLFLELMLGGFKLEAFPSTPNLVSEVWIPALDTSLLTFKLNVFRSECQGECYLLQRTPNRPLTSDLQTRRTELSLHRSYANTRLSSTSPSTTPTCAKHRSTPTHRVPICRHQLRPSPPRARASNFSSIRPAQGMVLERQPIWRWRSRWIYGRRLEDWS